MYAMRWSAALPSSWYNVGFLKWVLANKNRTSELDCITSKACIIPKFGLYDPVVAEINVADCQNESKGVCNEQCTKCNSKVWIF